MSGKDKDISRRKALAATGGIGGSVLGIPAVAAADSDNSSSTELEVNASEIEQSLAETPLVVARKEGGKNKVEQNAELNLNQSDIANDVDIYVGKYSNTEGPADQPFAIETLEEFSERDVPAAYDLGEDALAAHSSPDFYHEETLGSVSIGGHSVDIAIGVGGAVHFDGTSGGVELTFDLHTGPVTTTLFSQSVGVGQSEDGVCIDRLSIDYGHIPGFSVSGCIDMSVTSSSSNAIDIAVGVSLDACGDPCPIGSCEICHGVGGSFDINHFI